MSLPQFFDPKNDVAFKKLFGSEEHKDILIHFINDILGLEGKDMVQTVQFLSPVQNPEIAYKKQSIVDVLCEDENGVQIIVEMQVSPQEGFEKRAQYYAAKAYSRQLNQGQEEDGLYPNLKEVIFIAIANYEVFPEKKEYLSTHVILDRETYEHDLQDFSFTFLELPKFKKTKIDELEGIIEKWCYFFKYAKVTENVDFKKISQAEEVIGKAFDVMYQFNWTEAEKFEYEAELKRVRDNAAVEAYKMNHAKKEAEEKGRAEGRAEGRTEGVIQTAKNLLSLGVDVSTIQKATGLSQEEIEKIQQKNQ